MSSHDPISRVLAGGDVAQLAQLLGERELSADQLAPLIRRDRGARHLALLHLARRLDRPIGPSEAAQLARLLPVQLDDGPELALVLARLYRALAPWRTGPWPDWRTAGLPAAVAVEWLRGELASSPDAIRSEPYGELLLQALAPDTLAVAHDPASCLGALAERPEPALQQIALDQLVAALHGARLLPAEARRLLLGLAGSPDDGVAAAALVRLAEPWSLLLPPPGRAVTAALARPGVAAAALDCAARWQLEGPLRGAMENAALAPALRQRAMALAGGFVERTSLASVVAIAAGDPLLFGPPLLVFLRAQHRLGQFAGDDDAPAIAAIALANAALAADELAELMFPARHAFAAVLATAGADDPSWVRRAELLVALARGPQGQRAVAPGPRFAEVLARTAEPRVRRAMIAALGALGDPAAEADVLAQLAAEPAAALAALRTIGGPATVTAVLAALDPTGEPRAAGQTVELSAPSPLARHWLRRHRDAALTLAWQLSEVDAGARAAVRRALTAGSVPLGIEASLGARASADELALLHGALRNATASHYLRRVAAVAGATEWPVVSDLVLRVVSEVAAGAIVLPRDRDDVPWRVRNPAELGQPLACLPGDDHDALRAMGERLYRAGCLRPRALLDASAAGGPRDAGRLMVSALGRELLERADLTAGETAVVLRMLDPAVDRQVVPAIHRMLRRPEPDVRKLVVALLAAAGADGLLVNLTRLTGEDDIETVRQAIAALGGLGSRAAGSASALARCLDHRNMNIKKAAAEALATAGGPAAVPQLLFWLGYHDNPGFRALLIAALRAILGPAYAATVVAALVEPDPRAPDQDRRQQLLIAALGGVLAVGDAVALCRRSEPFAARLRQAISAGDVALASGDPAELAIAVPAPLAGADAAAPPPPLVELARALAEHGFHPGAARAVLAAARAPAVVWDPIALAELRRLWPAWCAQLDDDAPIADRAAATVLLARLAQTRGPDAGERAQLARRHLALVAVAGAADDDASRDAALDLVTAIAGELAPPAGLALAERVRALPERPNLSGRDPFAVLHACGALITRGDLDRALREARHTADPAALERRILRAAFAPAAPAARAWSAVATVPVGSGDGAPGGALLETEWRALEAAVREPGDQLTDLRARLHAPAAAVQGALIEAYPAAHASQRRAVVDWLEALQPLGAPRWTLAERAADRAARAAGVRRPQATDLDQPRSEAQRLRLLAMLDAASPEQQRTAVLALLSWPEPEPRALAADAYLRGSAAIEPSAALAEAAALLDHGDLAALLDDDDARPRLLGLLVRAPELAEAVLPALLEAHGDAVDAGDDDGCQLISAVVRALPVDAVLAAAMPRLAAGDFRIADALPGALPSSPELEAAIDHARRHGRDWLIERWRDSELGPARAHDLAAERAAFADAVSEFRTRGAARAGGPAPPSRDELLRDAASGTIDQVRRALTQLARDPDPEVIALLHGQLGHAHPRIRLHAHRLLRSCETREAYLEATLRLLDDPDDDVRRAAIRTLGFGRFAPAVPALIDRLGDPAAVVRRAAEDALVYLGEGCRGALRHALARARPDRRALYQRILGRLDRAGDSEP